MGLFLLLQMSFSLKFESVQDFHPVKSPEIEELTTRKHRQIFAEKSNIQEKTFLHLTFLLLYLNRRL